MRLTPFLRPYVVAVATLLYLSVVAPPASAATAGLDGATLRVAGAPGEANYFEITYCSRCNRFVDGQQQTFENTWVIGGSTVGGSLTAGAGCSEQPRGTDREVACPGAGVTLVEVQTGDGDNYLTHGAAGRAPPIPLHLIGGPGRDGATVFANGPVTLDLGDGSDTLDKCDAPECTVNGEGGDDALLGTETRAARYAGGAGNDQMFGGMGPDVLDGGDGNDKLFGSAGDDALEGGAGDDTLEAGDGADAVNGGPGIDVLKGEAGNDRLNGGSEADTLDAGPGDDDLKGGDGGDHVIAGDGIDRADGGGGDDRLEGGTGDDTLLGAGGRDSLDGQDGNDTLDGGRGDDSLTGGPGRNRLLGGAGNDRLNARNRSRDSVACGLGKRDLLRADRSDRVSGCERVRR